jgi:hypothetical protein
MGSIRGDTPGRPLRYGPLDEKEPIARTAGRYVRAAGIAIKKERARLAAESEARRAAEAAQAAQAAQLAGQQAAQAPPQPPPPVAPPPQAAAPPRKAPARPYAAPPPNRFLDRILWIGFIVTIVATCLVLLSVDSVMSGTTKTVFRLVVGAICLSFAVVVLTNWLHAKDRVLTTMTRKLWGLEEPRTRSGRFMRSVAKDVLTLIGIGWLAVGVLDILRVVVD